MKLAQEVQAAVDGYLQAGGLEASTLGRADYVLALLRIGTPAARQAAEKIFGRPITVCPPAIPPWPPKPVAKKSSEPAILRVGKNPCAAKSDAHRRFAEMRPGMTREQLRARGISARDLRKWKSQIEWTK